MSHRGNQYSHNQEGTHPTGRSKYKRITTIHGNKPTKHTLHHMHLLQTSKVLSYILKIRSLKQKHDYFGSKKRNKILENVFFITEVLGGLVGGLGVGEIEQ